MNSIQDIMAFTLTVCKSYETTMLEGN